MIRKWFFGRLVSQPQRAIDADVRAVRLFLVERGYCRGKAWFTAWIPQRNLACSYLSLSPEPSGRPSSSSFFYPRARRLVLRASSQWTLDFEGRTKKKRQNQPPATTSTCYERVVSSAASTARNDRVSTIVDILILRLRRISREKSPERRAPFPLFSSEKNTSICSCVKFNAAAWEIRVDRQSLNLPRRRKKEKEKKGRKRKKDEQEGFARFEFA